MSPPTAIHHHGILRHNSSTNQSINNSFSNDRMLIRSSTSSVADYQMPGPLATTNDDDTYASLTGLVGQTWRSHASSMSSPILKIFNPVAAMVSVFRSFFPALQSLMIPTCQLLAIAPSKSLTSTRSRSSSRKRPLIGTFFGHKKGRVSFAVQETPRSEPILLLELATVTSHLVKEMASGMVRILLECERKNTTKKAALLDEPVWTMYCNGHKLGHAVSRHCKASDLHVLSMVQTVSVGAGVMPAIQTLPPPQVLNPIDTVKGSTVTDGKGCGAQPDIMYMRAKFDRVIGSRDSEAFYMINPDCTSSRDGGKYNNGGPELSIFLLRI